MGPFYPSLPAVTVTTIDDSGVTVTEAEPDKPSAVAVTFPLPELCPAVKVVELPVLGLTFAPETVVAQLGSTLTGLSYVSCPVALKT